jgi:hypothetical protein
MYWENSYVALNLKYQRNKKATANIDKVLAGPGAEIIFIGSILFQSNGDNAKALVYVNKALT